MPNEKALSKLALITVLKKCSPEHRIRMINYLNRDGIQVLSEVIFNTLFNAPLTPAQKRKIRKKYSKDKKILTQIARKHGSLKVKRKLLTQTGGFMGTLLGTNIF